MICMWLLAWLLVGQTDPRNTTSAIIWSLVLIGLVLLAFAAVSLVRRWANKTDAEQPAGFTLGDLRQLHKSGKISQEEFERAKALILATVKRDSGTSAPRANERGDNPADGN